MSATVRAVAVIGALLVTVAVNALANILPIAGRTTGDISDGFPILFVPAGYVFSIWGLIYLGLAAYAVFQALPSQRDNPRLQAIAVPFVLSCLFNSVWIFAWHNLRIPLSMGLMLGVLATLVVIYLRLGTGVRPAPRGEALLVRLPFSIYLGWITVATVANASVTLFDLGWGGWGLGDRAWAVLLLLVAAAIGAAVLRTRRDAAYALVLVWAFAGIAVKHWGIPVVGVTAVVVAGLLLVLLAVAMASALRGPAVRT